MATLNHSYTLQINFNVILLWFLHCLASYLPKPSSQEYEFVYVDAKGEVCSRSSKFTFCAPKPLEDLVTLEEESHGEEGGTGMLLVVPRAELLQVSITNKGEKKSGWGWYGREEGD